MCGGAREGGRRPAGERKRKSRRGKVRGNQYVTGTVWRLGDGGQARQNKESGNGDSGEGDAYGK